LRVRLLFNPLPLFAFSFFLHLVDEPVLLLQPFFDQADQVVGQRNELPLALFGGQITAPGFLLM
jgi:hypothetical protein